MIAYRKYLAHSNDDTLQSKWRDWSPEPMKPGRLGVMLDNTGSGVTPAALSLQSKPPTRLMHPWELWRLPYHCPLGP